MTNIETFLQRLSWQRSGVRDQDRHWHPVHRTDRVSNILTISHMKNWRDHYPVRHPPHGTENFTKIATLLICIYM